MNACGHYFDDETRVIRTISFHIFEPITCVQQFSELGWKVPAVSAFSRWDEEYSIVKQSFNPLKIRQKPHFSRQCLIMVSCTDWWIGLIAFWNIPLFTLQEDDDNSATKVNISAQPWHLFLGYFVWLFSHPDHRRSTRGCRLYICNEHGRLSLIHISEPTRPY